MKKDKKFLEELGTYLKKSKYKEEIISKYEDIIKNQKKEGKKIISILKDLGNPKDIAEMEIKQYKSKKSFNIFKSIKNKFNSLKSKNKKNNETKEKKVKEKKKNKNEKSTFKEKFNNFKIFITKDLTHKKERKVTDSPKEIVEEIKEEVVDKISDVSEIVSEKKIFESKSTRIKRVILKTIGVIFTCLLVFIWLWITVMFFASLFAYLDGIKFKGLILLLFGIDLLVLWIVIMINRAIFKKRMSVKLNLIIIFILVTIIAYSIVVFLKETNSIQNVQDVSEKYSMIRKLETYDLPSESNEKFIITFNSNYNTQYVIKYDKNVKGKVKIDVRYYECYYDYYVKSTSNGAYVSLKLDNRDRLSVYLDDIKEGKIYDNDELSRYTVTIRVNPKEAKRIAIQK